MFKVIGFGLLILLLTACNRGGSLTAQEVFEKAKDASNNLEKVRTHIVFEESSRTIVPEERMSAKVEINSDASLQPLTFHQHTIVQVPREDSWEIDLYKMDNRAFMKDDKQKEWEELASGSIDELFGTLVARVNPVLDLSLFDAFQDDFELEKIDYGYLLKLTMTREQFKQFKEILLFSESSEEIDHGFSRIRKLDFEIAIDSNTFYTTDFKMNTDTTTYSTKQIDGNAHRETRKVNAIYSRFNNIDDVVVPKEVLEMSAR